MKKIYAALVLMLAMVTSAFAQDRPKFDPAKFEGALEQFVQKEAGLTQSEADAFMPVYREMRAKVRVILQDERKSFKKPTTEAQWGESILGHDEVELKIKKLQNSYHKRFIKLIPASKVARVIRAEDQFHRDALRTVQEKKRGNGNNQRGNHRHNGQRRNGNNRPHGNQHK